MKVCWKAGVWRLAFIGASAIWVVSLPAHAACSWSTLTNGTTANATQVMNNFDCLAPLTAPRFVGPVGINTASPNSTVGLDVVGGIYSQATKSNNVSSGSPNSSSVLSGPDAYWTLRSDTSNRFHLDVYNGGGGNQLAALTVLQSGTVGVKNGNPNSTVGLDVSGGIYSQATESNTVSPGSPNSTGVLTAPGAYWALRSDTAHRFHLDIYNGGAGNQLAALTAAQNGYIGVGRPNPGEKLDVAGTIRQSNCTTAGTLSTNASGDIICTSDARLKHVKGPYKAGLEAVGRLNPVLFTYRPTKSNPSETFVHAGFLAQDVRAVIPHAVAQQKDGFYSLETTAILATTVNAVNELKAENDRLRAKVDRLLVRINAMERRLYIRTAKD